MTSAHHHCVLALTLLLYLSVSQTCLDLGCLSLSILFLCLDSFLAPGHQTSITIQACMFLVSAKEYISRNLLDIHDLRYDSFYKNKMND